MLKTKFLLIVLVVIIVILAGCTSKSADWASNFVVWDSYIYIVSDEYTENVGDVVGEVTHYSDREAIYIGNFSNYYKKGTQYYSIEGVSTQETIAIKENDKFRIANQDGKYGGK